MQGSNFAFSAALVVAFLFLFGAVSEASMDPKQILYEVKSRGASTVVGELYGDQSAWNSIIENIASGEAIWIDVAVALRVGSDAGASSMLHDGLFQALGKNPDYVLSRAEPSYPIAELCTGRHDPPPLLDQAMTEQETILASVRRVSTEQLKVKKADCLQHLEDGKAQLLRFFGHNQ